MLREQRVFAQVEVLYKNSSTQLGKWMWENHVQFVADTSKKLADKYSANTEWCYVAALLHDIGDCLIKRDDSRFNAWSYEKASEILTSCDFSQKEIKNIITEIIQPHSCKPGLLPHTLNGKVLATADAIFHLDTGFFPLFCYLNCPEAIGSYQEWQNWCMEKIERDFRSKIFFEEERKSMEGSYTALKTVFGNTTLDRNIVM